MTQSPTGNSAKVECITLLCFSYEHTFKRTDLTIEIYFCCIYYKNELKGERMVRLYSKAPYEAALVHGGIGR